VNVKLFVNKIAKREERGILTSKQSVLKGTFGKFLKK
jgi:hypothetical protein